MANLCDFVADVGVAPRSGQSPSPADVFGARFAPVGPSVDLTRILALPRRPVVVRGSARAEALIESIMDRYSLRIPSGACRCAEIDPQIRLGVRTCITRPLAEQAQALHELEVAGGLVGALGVGVGKTLIDVMAAWSLVAHGVERVLLLAPSTLVSQLLMEYDLIGQHFRVPTLVIHDDKNRAPRVVPGAPVVHVYPYSRLQLPTSSDWIKNLKPQAIFADECDALADSETSRASRLYRYAIECGNRGEDIKYGFWTGSITDSSIENYWRFMALALRDRSPMPYDLATVEEWGRAIDPGDSPAPAGALLQLCAPGEPVHSGYRRRLAETLGVIVSTVQSSTAELSIRVRPAPELPSKVVEALDKARNWTRPDTMGGSDIDEEMVDALQVAKVTTEIAAGMFYRWVFPHGEHEDLILEWLQRRKDWNKELRSKLKARDEFLDSPLLCEHAAMRHHGDAEPREDRPSWEAVNWPAWRDIRDRVNPETEAVWIDDFLAADAARWALENRGIVWYANAEFGRRVAQLSGLPLHGGGPTAGERIRTEDGSRSIICSIKSHGRGRDGLQRLFDQQLVAQPPSSNRMWEQMLGRLARQGQASRAIQTWVYVHTQELQKAIDQALMRAGYVRDTLGADQKLLLGWRG